MVKVNAGGVQLASGETLDGDLIIVASGHPELPSNASSPQWRSVDTLYFNTLHPGFGKPILGSRTSPPDTPGSITSIFCTMCLTDPVMVSVTVMKNTPSTRKLSRSCEKGITSVWR